RSAEMKAGKAQCETHQTSLIEGTQHMAAGFACDDQDGSRNHVSFRITPNDALHFKTRFQIGKRFAGTDKYFCGHGLHRISAIGAIASGRLKYLLQARVSSQSTDALYGCASGMSRGLRFRYL